MDNFSYTDSVRAALASCLPCFAPSHSKPPSNPPLAAARPAGVGPTSSANDLEHLLRDADSDALSLHSHFGAASTHRRSRHRRRPKFSLTLFGYTLFGRPPIYLDDDDNGDGEGVPGRRTRAAATASSSTLDSDAAPLDASTIDRLASPDHYAALMAQREAEEAARQKAERRARRQERKARARAEALVRLTGGSPPPDVDTFEGFQESGDGMVSPPHVVRDHADLDRLSRDGSLHSGDADDADLGGGLYARKKRPSAALSGSGSDSRSRTSASLSAGDASHIHHTPISATHQHVRYPQTEMHFPAPEKSKPRRSKRTSAVSSLTSQSTSTAPYTPAESIAEMPAVAAFPVPQERYTSHVERTDFPSVGLSGKRRPTSLDPRTFLAYQA